MYSIQWVSETLRKRCCMCLFFSGAGEEKGAHACMANNNNNNKMMSWQKLEGWRLIWCPCPCIETQKIPRAIDRRVNSWSGQITQKNVSVLWNPMLYTYIHTHKPHEVKLEYRKGIVATYRDLGGRSPFRPCADQDLNQRQLTISQKVNTCGSPYRRTAVISEVAIHLSSCAPFPHPLYIPQ